MLDAVIGGKLQGIEAVYLSKKAGWKTLLIDKAANVPAVGLSLMADGNSDDIKLSTGKL